jgi:hypothetical protein
MRRLLTLSCVLAATVLAACGGDDRLSAPEYRAQAKTICTDADKATEAIKQPTRATSDAIADYFRRLLAANDRTTKRFEGLEPPEDLEKAHKDALKANADGVGEVRRVIRELDDGGDPRAVLTEAQSRLEALSRRSGDAAKRLKVPECADR